jgi:YaiO family outer membrane protein
MNFSPYRLLCLTLLVLSNSPVWADERTYDWGASATDAYSQMAAGTAQESTLSLRRYTDLGSIAVEQWHIEEFGSTGDAVAIDAYPHLWQGGYANVRYQHSDQSWPYPVMSWRAELFQNAGHGWELSASHDYLGFASQVQIDGVGVGKYWGDFYARLRLQEVHTTTSNGNGARFLIRYYYEGDADHYIEGNISSGHSDDYSTSLIQLSRSQTQGVAFYHFLNHDWGVKGSYSHSLDDSIYGGYQNTLSLGLVRRW